MARGSHGEHGSSTPGRRTIAQGLFWPLWLLTFAGWAIVLGGLATTQHRCYHTDVGNTGTTIAGVDGGLPAPGPGDVGLGLGGRWQPFYGCQKLYRFWWWVLAYEIFIWSLVAVFAVAGRLFATRNVWLALFAIATVMKILACDDWLNYRDYSNNSSGGSFSASAIKATLAGWIVLCFANFLMTISFGLDPHMKRDRDWEDKGHHSEYATTTTTAARPAATGYTTATAQEVYPASTTLTGHHTTTAAQV